MSSKAKRAAKSGAAGGRRPARRAGAARAAAVGGGGAAGGKINQADINSAAWAACDTFRGVVDPAQYKDYILVTLFVKYISDVWNDRREQYERAHPGDAARVRRKMAREAFVLPEVKLQADGGKKITDRFPAAYGGLYERRNAPNIGELFNVVLEHIEEGNAKLKGVFRNIDFNSEANLGQTRERNRRLCRLLEDFNKPQLDMRPSRVSEDVIGNTYMFLIERFAADSGRKAGEFYTPHAVSEALARLTAPRAGGRICDPACGSGGLLIQAAREAGGRDFALYGQESNGGTWALCRMNMFLHGHAGARIEWGDTLNNPLLAEGDRLMKFDSVIANPPFSLDKWGAENAAGDRWGRYWRGVPPAGKGDWAFISHMLESAKDKSGRVGVVVPHGVLFRGAAEGRIRRSVVEDNLLDAVIGLPAGLFQTTGIPVAILIFDRAREKGGAREKRRDVLFIDASREFIAGKKQNTLGAAHIAKIVKAYEKRRGVKKYAARVRVKEIAENGYNLNIPRYVDTFEEEEDIDINAVQREITALEKELAAVRAQMTAKLRALKRR